MRKSLAQGHTVNDNHTGVIGLSFWRPFVTLYSTTSFFLPLIPNFLLQCYKVDRRDGAQKVAFGRFQSRMILAYCIVRFLNCPAVEPGLFIGGYRELFVNVIVHAKRSAPAWVNFT
jgi:hypothetical protein